MATLKCGRKMVHSSSGERVIVALDFGGNIVEIGASLAIAFGTAGWSGWVSLVLDTAAI